jgi:PIN domain nuclease of toxin-antitoxin system
MRLLLDTHAIVWWFSGNRRLSSAAQQAIANPTSDNFVSAASAWEIATKYRLGKMPSVAALANDFRNRVAGDGFHELPITLEQALRAGSLPGPHRDPFDRLLIAQAITDELLLVSNETRFDHYGVQRLW